MTTTSTVNQFANTHEDEEESRRRREQLERRPSYKKILEDLAQTGEAVSGAKQQKLDNTLSASLNLMPRVPGPQLSINTSNLEPLPMSRLLNSTLAMRGRQVPHLPGPQPPTQVSGGHLLTNSFTKNHLSATTPPLNSAIPTSTSTPDSTSTTLSSPNTSFPCQANMMTNIRGLTPLGDTPASTPSMLPINATAGNYNNSASSTPSPVPSSSGKESLAGESHKESRDNTQAINNAKRQQRLEKNREAAKECRRKKKEYVRCLENRVQMLEAQNKQLIMELKSLKELYCRKEKIEP